MVPTRALVALDGLAGLTGDLWQLTPSVFVRADAVGTHTIPAGFFRCPACGGVDLREEDPSTGTGGLRCASCHRLWPLREGIYDFKEAIEA
jgi:hypothetical protein